MPVFTRSTCNCDSPWVLGPPATRAGVGEILSAGETTVSLEFRFDEQGQNVSVFAPDRFYDDGKQPPVARAWEARNSTFGVHHGVTVATAAVAEWQLPEGLFAYWRGRPVRVDYRVSPPAQARSSAPSTWARTSPPGTGGK